MSISDEKYVSLTTYRKNGQAKECPVWIVDLGNNEMGFTTHGESWKCKRIRNDDRIMLQPCDQRGNITAGTSTVSGTARLATGADFDRTRAAVKKKYGFMVNVIIAMNKIGGLFGKGGDSDTAVIMVVDEAE